MALSEDVLKIMAEEEERVEGAYAAAQLAKARDCPIWYEITVNGFREELADQIYERYQKKQWDYTTPEYAVISNCKFPGQFTHTDEMVYDERGRVDMPPSLLPCITPETMARPKLPGRLLTKKQVVSMGRRTCYESVEMVGNALYGLYPAEQICDCCLFNKPEPLANLQLAAWHEGVMVFINGIEYRVRHKEAMDRPHRGIVWEHEKENGIWVPRKPRGKNKRPQKEKPMVTTAMVTAPPLAAPVIQKQQMSKALVETRSGWFFYPQQGVWDMVGGKQVASDLTPLRTMMREYQEETRLQMPPPLYLGHYESEAFRVHLYYVRDDRLSANASPSMLTGLQAKSMEEAYKRLLQKDRVVRSDLDSRISQCPNRKLTAAQRKRKQVMEALRSSIYETTLELQLPVVYHLLPQGKGYALPYSQEQCAKIKETLAQLMADGWGEADALKQALEGQFKRKMSYVFHKDKVYIHQALSYLDGHSLLSQRVAEKGFKTIVCYYLSEMTSVVEGDYLRVEGLPESTMEGLSWYCTLPIYESDWKSLEERVKKRAAVEESEDMYSFY